MGGQHARVTQADEQKVRELHAQGLGRNAIARQIGRSPLTVAVIADRLQLSFDRTHTAVAAEARKGDAKARRAAIIEGLYDVVEASMGASVRYGVNRLPAQGRKALSPASAPPQPHSPASKPSTATRPPVRRCRAGTPAGLGSWRGLRR
ncbi:hypothetical protein [Streptomyces exfoliatus]|uniref:hypothetical protein n=1 Tax=Streptomyces exfoliatus TaxID=1905 RepID=UPI003C2E8111